MVHKIVRKGCVAEFHVTDSIIGKYFSNSNLHLKTATSVKKLLYNNKSYKSDYKISTGPLTTRSVTKMIIKIVLLYPRLMVQQCNLDCLICKTRKVLV